MLVLNRKHLEWEGNVPTSLGSLASIEPMDANGAIKCNKGNTAGLSDLGVSRGYISKTSTDALIVFYVHGSMPFPMPSVTHLHLDVLDTPTRGGGLEL